MEERIHPKGSGFGGKFTRLPKEFREKLSAPLPKEAIQKHPTKTFLSTIKQIFVTERLNDVFGIGGWTFEHERVGIFENDTYSKTKTKTGFKKNVVVMGRLYSVTHDLYTAYQYGGGDIEGFNTDPSDGFKGAVTDCMSKCASLWEIGIQVFKGKPGSQEGNKSKLKDENDDIALLLEDTYKDIKVTEGVVYTRDYLKVNYPTVDMLKELMAFLKIDPNMIDGDDYDDYASAIMNFGNEEEVKVERPAPKKTIEKKEVEPLSEGDASETISLMLGWDKLIPPLSEKTGARSVSKQKIAYDQLTKIGINDDKCLEYMEASGLPYDDKKALCKVGSKEEILEIAEMHKNA